MKRITVFIYGVISYAIFFATFCYAYGWVGNLWVPRSIDAAPETSLTTALLVNLLLLTAFAVQHSVMARPAFKSLITSYIPKPAERPTYVLASSLCLIALFYFWRPMGLTIWQVEDPVASGVLYGILTFGFLLVLVSTFLINHFDLFGLRQVWLYLRKIPYTPVRFTMPGPYKHVRHPLYVGWLLAFWATPHMTLAHLVFALATTGYILVAIQLEERDLMAEHGSKYVDYRRSVPMLVPSLTPKGGKAKSQPEAA